MSRLLRLLSSHILPVFDDRDSFEEQEAFCRASLCCTLPALFPHGQHGFSLFCLFLLLGKKDHTDRVLCSSHFIWGTHHQHCFSLLLTLTTWLSPFCIRRSLSPYPLPIFYTLEDITLHSSCVKSEDLGSPCLRVEYLDFISHGEFILLSPIYLFSHLYHFGHYFIFWTISQYYFNYSVVQIFLFWTLGALSVDLSLRRVLSTCVDV